jgi:hypothetical protein
MYWTKEGERNVVPTYPWSTYVQLIYQRALEK